MRVSRISYTSIEQEIKPIIRSERESFILPGLSPTLYFHTPHNHLQMAGPGRFRE